MPKLFRPMEHAHRGQIKIRAAAQNREMTKKSVKKGTQKKQVYFGKIQKQIQQKKEHLNFQSFCIQWWYEGTHTLPTHKS